MIKFTFTKYRIRFEEIGGHEEQDRRDRKIPSSGVPLRDQRHVIVRIHASRRGICRPDHDVGALSNRTLKVTQAH